MKKIIYTKEKVAALQLESAIWMYAYDFDEIAVHTVAAAAFELYVQRLELGNFKKEINKRIVKGKEKYFWNRFNKANNYFKHGGRNDEKLTYYPDSVEYLLLASCEANIMMDDKLYKVASADSFLLYFILKHPNTINNDNLKIPLKKLNKEAKSKGLNLEDKLILKSLLGTPNTNS